MSPNIQELEDQLSAARVEIEQLMDEIDSRGKEIIELRAEIESRRVHNCPVCEERPGQVCHIRNRVWNLRGDP